MTNWIEEFNRPARYKIAYGGRGSGKSWGIARLLLYLVHDKNAPLRILCAREFQSSIADSVHRLLADSIMMLQLDGFYIGRTEIRHRNGAVFFFKGLARNPHSIKSAEGIDIVWVEEAHAVSEESWIQLIPTIRRPDSEIWMSYNPRYLDDPTCRRFYGENAPKNAIVCTVNWHDNPFFPDVLLQEKNRDYARDPELAAHVWEGKPLQFSSAQVLRGKWTVEKVTPLPHWDGPYFGIDWGITDPTTAVKCWLADDVLYVEQELYARGVDDMVAFLNRMPELKTHVARADNAWPETINHVKKSGGYSLIKPCEKLKIEDGITWLRGLKNIVINPECKNTINEAGLWRWKTDSTGNVLPKLADGNDHCWDAIRYAMEPVIRKTKIKINHLSTGNRTIQNLRGF